MPGVESLPPLRDVIESHGLWARKSLGQNFLTDTNLLDRIVRTPGDLTGQTVYEVGPGPGGLTRALLRAGVEKLVAVERDPRCLSLLADISAVCAQLHVVAGNALAIEEAAIFPRPAHIVANLPYNVGTALLTRWLTGAPWWASMTLMFQKEVAQRIVATPDSSAYGRLSVLTQARATARIAFDVPARAFVPPPKVTSAVVHFLPLPSVDFHLLRNLEIVTAAAFGQRRKMLRTALKQLTPEPEVWLEAVGIDPTQRAETVTVAQFQNLARLYK
jgi:16S rRNA (adenine1518-N6/adenine1519-N6)-dimethyltransferase